MSKVDVFCVPKNVLFTSVAIGMLIFILQSSAFADNVVSFDDSNEASFSTLKQAHLRSKGVTFFSETGSKLNSIGMSKGNPPINNRLGFNPSPQQLVKLPCW